MNTVIIQASDADLSQLLARVEAGEELTLGRGAIPIAKLVPVKPAPVVRREYGSMRGQGYVGPEFFDPLPEEELAAWDQ